MFDTCLEDRPEADVATALALCEPPGAPCKERPARVRPDDLARFVRDPMAYATRAGAVTPEAFVKAYLEGLERRLSGVVGAPREEGFRLATLAAESLPVGDLVETAGGGGELDRSPRMGPVIVACAVVQAAATVVAAAAAVYTALAKRSQK